MTMSYPQQQAYPPPGPMPPARKPPAPKKWGWIVGIIGAFVLGLIIGIAANPDAGKSGTADATGTVTAPASGTAADATTTPPPQQPAGPAATMGSGTYQVGVDVLAGQYKTPGPGSDNPLPCYWSRNKDDSGELTSIIANSVVQGPGSVTVNDGEFIELSGDCTWTRVG